MDIYVYIFVSHLCLVFFTPFDVYGLLLEPVTTRQTVAPVFQIPRDCQDYLWEGYRENRLYTIYPQKSGRLDVFCDQLTDGGGWTVIQRRTDGSEDFFRNWTDYKYGFGNKSNEFWLGNHRIYEIVSQGYYELRIDMGDFAGETRYAIYRRFSVGDESQGYKLTIEDYTGTAGDSMARQNGAQFYTKDHDSNNCAAMYKGGWWYENCHDSNLNGIYLRGTHSSFADGIEWRTWHGYKYSLKFTEMKIRRL
ncbi:fibrinogen C domain-containing protein 1-like [Saccostrea echinata]|uniref:fibrinogen C domain-containing protein 1-like n=1 Tax=Saccostrea echinata TaxID=191078 RepID=UPI002A820685|nr:fibrinogen C domain-containing protein 1-like [Saccostrea echinata]